MMPTPVNVVAWYGMLMCCGGPGARARVLTSPMTFGLARGPSGSLDARPPAGLLRMCAKCQALDWSDMTAPGQYPRAPEAALQGRDVGVFWLCCVPGGLLTSYIGISIEKALFFLLTWRHGIHPSTPACRQSRQAS